MSTEKPEPVHEKVNLRTFLTVLDDLHERAWCARWSEIDELATALGYRGDLADGEAAGAFVKDRLGDALRHLLLVES